MHYNAHCAYLTLDEQGIFRPCIHAATTEVQVPTAHGVQDMALCWKHYAMYVLKEWQPPEEHKKQTV